MTIDYANGGLVGIGTTSPDRLLSLKHASQAEIGFKTGSVSNGALIYYNDSEDQLLLRAQESSDSITFQTGGTTERMRIDSSGNLGIGSSRTDRGLLNINHDNTGDAFSGSHIALTYDVSPTNNDSKAGITYATSDSDNYGYFQGAERTTSGQGAFVLRYHNNSAGGTKVMEVNSNGAVSKFLQPAFLARPTSNQNNIATSTDVTVVLGTEVFDQGSDFASNLFTAPITGRYQISFCLNLRNVDTAADYYEVQIVTSNRNYNFIQDPDYGQDSVYFSISGSALCDMDASDTARFKIVQAGGTAQTDISTESHFSGYLAC